MSGKSKNSSKVIDRPFAAAILKEARKIAGGYQVLLRREDGQWFGRGLEMPNVFADGKTPAQCLENVQEAMTFAAAFLLEQGQRPPAAANEGTRKQQVNVRLTAEEKALLESTARRKGFSGLSDFIRAAALESAK
jgi:predicted RNase H-like HicB family nuclease